MKKTLIFLLAVMLGVTLFGCSKPAGNNTGLTAQADPIDQYVGKYRCIKMTSPDDDYTEFLKTSWEDKSFYEYVEITKEGKMTLYSISHGEKNVLFEYNFDPEACSIYLKEDKSDAFPLGYNDGTIVLTVDNGPMLTFEKTDEIE